MAAHTYWRIYVLNSNGISQPTPKRDWTEIEEVEMRGTVGGADQCNGGTITASNEWAPTYTAARAFDNGATSYYWATNLWTNNGIATWLKYQFPAPVWVAQLLIKAKATDFKYAPREFRLEWSDNNSTWTSVGSWTSTGWANGETRTFLSTPPPQVKSRHVDRHSILTGEALVVSRCKSRHAMLTGEVITRAEHLDLYDLLTTAKKNHHGRYRMLAGESEVAARHDSVWMTEKVGQRMVGRHRLLAGEILVGANHADVFGIFMGVEHRAVHSAGVAADHHGSWAIRVAADHLASQAMAVAASREGKWALTNRGEPVAGGHRSRHQILTGEALTGQERQSRYAILVQADHRNLHAGLFPVGSRHVAPWRVAFFTTTRHVAPSRILAFDPVQARHVGSWSLRLAADRLGSWSAMPQVQGDHLGIWGAMPMVAASHGAAFRMTADARQHHSGRHALLAFDPAMAEHRADHAIHSGEIRIVTDQPSLIHQGRTISLRSAEIRADDGSFTWLARMEIGEVEEWIAIRVGDAVSLDLYGEVFSLIVDDKEMSRDNAGASVSLILLAVSPLAMRRDRVTRAWSGPVDARQAVGDLLGMVEWLLPDWTIPSGRVAVDRTDPVALARQIAGAAGGVVESMPDGSIVCRPHFPLAVPQWQDATPDQIITDDETISDNQSYTPVELVDRIAVADEDLTAGADSVEFIVDDGDPNHGMIRVYPFPWRPVVVVHTGDDYVLLTTLGEQEWEESEVIPIISGKGNTKYPVVSITSSSWQYANLGSVLFGSNTRDVASGIPESSMLRITYRTRCLAWTAANVRDEDILFLVTDP